MGFTSRAKMVQMGVDDVIWGLLTDGMLAESSVDVSRLIHPRIEPEIAYLIGREVRSVAEVESAVAGVAVGFEVLDPRYQDFKFTLADGSPTTRRRHGSGTGPGTSRATCRTPGC